MDNILSELLEQRKEYIKKKLPSLQIVTLTKDENRRLRKALKKYTEKVFVPQPLFSEKFQQEQERRIRGLQNTEKIFGMQIEVVT